MRYEDRSKFIDFDKFIGCEASFYGVSDNKFKLGSVVFEAIEDPQDEYRSSLDGIIIDSIDSIDDYIDSEGNLFSDKKIANVKIIELNGYHDRDNYWRELDGYGLQDIKNGKLHLVIGTNNSDDYYPSFTFEYFPVIKEKIEEKEDNKEEINNSNDYINKIKEKINE